jgi:hypothetical protein
LAAIEVRVLEALRFNAWVESIYLLKNSVGKEHGDVFFSACPWPRPGSYGMNKDIKDEK